MISFANDFQSNNDKGDSFEEQLLETLEIMLTEDDYNDPIANLSEIIDVIYKKLYVDNENNITLKINKSKNNSLNFTIQHDD